MKRVIYLFIVCLGLSACNDSGDDNSSGQPFKTLFSLWTEDDNTSSFDLSGGAFASPFVMNFLLVGGEICQCTVTALGDEQSGTIAVNNCNYISGGSGDPGCAAIFENGGQQYTFSKSGLTLNLCSQSSCGDYD